MIDAKINKSLMISRIGIFASLYAVTSFIPISFFIGAPSFLALNLVMTPTMAILLSPVEALFASLFGGVISFYLSPAQAMFGPFSILLPMAGATLGSLAFHNRKIGGILTGGFLGIAIFAYLVRNSPFPFFVSPHIVALGIVSLSIVKGMTPLKYKVPLYAFVSTMVEQGMMMIFAVYLLGLPWQVFVGILPLMIYERLIGAIGGVLIIFAVLKAIPKYSFLNKY